MLNSEQRPYEIFIRFVPGYESRWIILMNEQGSLGFGIIDIIDGSYETALAIMFNFRLQSRNNVQMPYMRIVGDPNDLSQAHLLFCWDRHTLNSPVIFPRKERNK